MPRAHFVRAFERHPFLSLALCALPSVWARRDATLVKDIEAVKRSLSDMVNVV
jgi:hypothetical protein